MRSTLLCKCWLVKQRKETSPILFLSPSSLCFPFCLVLILQLHTFFSLLQLPSCYPFSSSWVSENGCVHLMWIILDVIELGQFVREIWKISKLLNILCQPREFFPAFPTCLRDSSQNMWNSTNCLRSSPTSVFGPLNSCFPVAWFIQSPKSFQTLALWTRCNLIAKSVLSVEHKKMQYKYLTLWL